MIKQPRLPLFAFGAIASSLLSFYIIFWLPYYSFYGPGGAVVKARNEVESLAAKIVVAEKHAAQVNAIPETERERIALAIPKQNQGDQELIVIIESLAKEAGILSVDEIKFVDDQIKSQSGLNNSMVKTHLAQINVTVSDYEGLKRFVVALESSLRIMEVESLVYDSANESAILTIKSYVVF